MKTNTETVVNKQAKAFSLIELLVVIAIIGLLSAILFPVFASARESARKSACVSNLKQIGMAISSYNQDYDGDYPNTNNFLLWNGRYWRWPLQPYLAMHSQPDNGNPLVSNNKTPNVLLCPSDRAAQAKYDGTSYALSMALYVAPDELAKLNSFTATVTPPGPTCSSQNESAMVYPSQKVTVTEWTSNHTPPAVGWNNPTTAFIGARNMLFGDGHVHFTPMTNIKPGYNGLPDINTTVGGIAGSDLIN